VGTFYHGAMKSNYSEDRTMADTPWIREPSVKTVVKDNGNRTALEQFALLTLVPAAVFSGLYLAVRSQMTVDAWWTLLTIAGVAVALVALVRFGRYHKVELDPAKTRRPAAAQFGFNLIVNSWPFLLTILWQAAVVDQFSLTLANNWPVVIAFITCTCAIISSIFFGRRMIRELLDPLAGNSIEIGVRERELRHELKMKTLEAKRAQASVEYARQLEGQVADLTQQLDKAKRGSRVIYSNHGSARGDSSHHIDNNELFNQFVIAAFEPGTKKTRDEWSRFLIADPGTETTTNGRQRYDEYRLILEQAGLWNLKSGPIKTLEQACTALRIPLPHHKNASAGGRAGVESALATPPDFESGVGGSDE